MRRTTRSSTLLAATLLMLGGLGVSPASAQPGGPGGTFIDDNGNVQEGSIEAIVADGITQGCVARPAQYCPGSVVVRADMAVFLDRALDLSDTPTDFFPDDNGLPQEASINRVAEAGISLGNNGRFLPADPVLRDAMASFLVRGFDLPAGSPSGFSDVAEGNVHRAAIDSLRQAGVTLGCGGTNYCPGSTVIRADMAAFLARSLGLTPITPAPVTTFGPGRVLVGQPIPAGTYRSSAAPAGTTCDWERTSDDTGSEESVLGSDFHFGRGLATILPGDRGFESGAECGTWTNDLSPITSSPTAPITGGVYLVGTDISAGTWQTTTADGFCFWARLSAFTGASDGSATITNDIDADPTVTVVVEPGDAGFLVDEGCGTWSRIG